MVFLQPLLHGWQPISATGGLPLPKQHQQFGALGHQPERGFGAIEVAVDLVANGGLNLHHLSSQRTDFATNFINSVVHGLLEQKENIESSYRFEKEEKR
jgi:hypothetical protein